MLVAMSASDHFDANNFFNLFLSFFFFFFPFIPIGISKSLELCKFDLRLI